MSKWLCFNQLNFVEAAEILTAQNDDLGNVFHISLKIKYNQLKCILVARRVFFFF